MRAKIDIAENLISTKETLPAGTILVAVTKTRGIPEITEAYATGHRIFGENKVQEMVGKYEAMPKDICWHMIGHLQRNKVKYIAGFVSLIHGVDSLRLLQEINKQGIKHQRQIPCLLQVHIAEEQTKFGLDHESLIALLQSEELSKLNNITIKGLMGMATYTKDQNQVRKEFAFLKSVFDQAKNYVHNIDVLSMGMSADYRVAIEEGSTMVRIGSGIFGERKQV